MPFPESIHRPCICSNVRKLPVLAIAPPACPPRQVLLALLLLFGSVPSGALAQEQANATGSTPAPAEPGKPASVNELEAVVVTGTSDRNDRRESTTTKIVVTRDDLARHGDSTVADVLNRVPGVSVTGTSGRSSDVRMRGLGNGYTQILLNGDPAPSGFSLDSLSPNLIERIEISRTATADQSAQAIAGTINIILKQVVRQGQRDAKASVSSENGQPSTNFDAQLSDRSGAVSYTVAASLRSQKYVMPSTVLLRSTDARGLPVSGRLTSRTDTMERYTASLTPRLNWTASERDKVVIDGFLSWQQGNYGTRDAQTLLVGSPPLYGDNDIRQGSGSRTLRGRISWTRSLEDDASLEIKLGSNWNRRVASVNRRSVLPGQAFDAANALALDRSVYSLATDKGFTLNGRYRAPYHAAHAVALGWDSESARRGDDRIQRDSISTVAPPEDLDQLNTAQVRRLAVFAQDEWDITTRWSAYSGLRWEGLETRSDSNTLAAVTNRFSVLSPILQTLWKVPDTAGDQVRLGVSRTYKAPATTDLIARRYRYYDNTATSPDSEGNPALGPELAWGMDLAYERHFEENGLLSANVFARNIRDVILQELFIDNNGRYVLHPVNDGNAQVRGIELEAKSNLRALSKTAPDVDVRANLARNWSVLSAVPGPYNRLAKQIPVTANLGADWRPAGLPLTLGANFGFQSGGWVRLSAAATESLPVRRSLDAYGLWKIDSKTQLRFSLTNLLHQQQVEENVYQSVGGTQDQTVTAPSFTTFRVALELKL